jgi:hypothetical protein
MKPSIPRALSWLEPPPSVALEPLAFVNFRFAVILTPYHTLASFPHM